jgi:Transposase DDE domain
MKKSTMFQSLLQSVLSEEEVIRLAERIGYTDTARKFSVYTLLQYWTQAAFEQWNGYRDGADRAAACGLAQANYSTFSKKAKAVPFELFKRLFHLMLQKCNRQTQRQLKLPKELLLVDSTTITVGKARLPWAPFHGERAGVKLHVAFHAASGQPQNVVETVGSRHDGPVGEELANSAYILVQDRAYGKIERFDRYKMEGQSFVIRLKDNVHIVSPCALRRQETEGSPVTRDVTCLLGTTQCRSQERHRMVEFHDGHGHEIRVVTDLRTVCAEQIAEIYKNRWQIELFFRWIKQHLNVPTLFGTTENAVYGQLYSALIVYVLLKFFYDTGSSIVPRHATLAFAPFSRLLLLDQLPQIWLVKLSIFKERFALFEKSCFPLYG